MIRKWRNQIENPSPKTEVKRTKLTVLGSYTKGTYRKPSESKCHLLTMYNVELSSGKPMLNQPTVSNV